MVTCILHASIDAAGVLVWAERADPFAVDANELRSVLGQVDVPDAAACAAVEATAWLPSTDAGPVASSPVLGREDAAGAEAAAPPLALRAQRVPALRLTPRQARALLHRCGTAGDRVLAPGVVPATELAVLARAARLAGAVVLRQEHLPDLVLADEGEATAHWAPVLRDDTRAALRAVAASLPPAATALDTDPDAARRGAVPPPPPLPALERLVAALVDDLVRTVQGPGQDDPATSLHDRWLGALAGADPAIAGEPVQLRQLADDVAAWQRRVRRATESPFRLCLRLEEPDDADLDEDEDDPATHVWFLRYLLQVRDEPSIQFDVADCWTPQGSTAKALRRLGYHEGEHLLAPLGEAARLCEPVADSLREEQPNGCELTTRQAHELLTQAAPLLEQAGFGMLVPGWWRVRGSSSSALNVRAHVRDELAGGRRMLSALNLRALVSYDWRLAIGDATLTAAELRTLADQKSSLVRVRGRWVELDPEELRAALARIDRIQHDPRTRTRGGRHHATIGELLAMSVGAGRDEDGLPVGGVDAGADLDALLVELAQHELPEPVAPPVGLRAELRPYQQRGFEWLVYMMRMGLGACLADDMGLGKTVQALAAVQHAWEQPERGPTLVVCPTSVLTNWRSECAQFVPELPVLVHHGGDRLRDGELATAAAEQAVVVTSYALLARDVEALREVEWSCVVLDEAQQIKNPRTRHAAAARALRAPARIALTGTPIENGLGDLWSIMQFLNPGLLGGAAEFRRRYILPVQSGALPEQAGRLRGLVAPFVLRREKTDRSVIDDLPERFERVEHCQLTTEQVTLYEAIVRDAEKILRSSKAEVVGVERRGLILATISRLKQVCNHPAQLLGDNSAVAGRSGKLERLEQLVEQVLDVGERALVFTQFVAMGELLREHLRATFGREVLFLHGGTPRRARDAMVARFQSGAPEAPPLLVLSLKAGGSGLNLTAANHVVHYDRWWNPATEQQASDRAFRIGQTRDVQVHALVCAGTVEERVARMLDEKRGLAGAVIGSGEQWLAELDDGELLELLRLRRETLLEPERLDDTGKEWKLARL